MVLNKIVQLELKVPMEVADVDEEAVVVVTSIDTAEVLEGKDTPLRILCTNTQSNFFSESEKQAAHAWGATEGGAELADEQAGEAIANAEQKEALTGDGDAAPVADGAPAAEPEPEDNSISYADYLAQQAEKKLALGTGVPEPRKPNEGSKQDKKWANAQAIAKEEEEEFVPGTGGKAKRERERKQKQLVDIDYDFKPSQEAERGGRGGFRGRGEGRGRGGRGGEFRGRGRGEGRGRGGADGGRSDYQRGEGRPRGAPRGGASLKIEDTSAFPSLGS